MFKKEGNITITSNNTTLNRQVQSPPSTHFCISTPATALLPPGEGDNSPTAAVHLPLEGNSLPNSQASNNNVAVSSTSNNNNITSNSVSNQTNSQTSQVPHSTKHQQLLTFLPGKEAIISREVHTFPRKLVPLPLNLIPLPQGKKTILPKPILLQLLITPLGHPKQGIATTPPGQVGKALGTPQTSTLSTFP